MAEGLLKQALTSAGKGDCVVSSAGLGALVGHPPDAKACQLMMKKGIDISGYRACQLDKDMIRKADLILVMEPSHKSAIEKIEPYAKGKVFLPRQLGGFRYSRPLPTKFIGFCKIV